MTHEKQAYLDHSASPRIVASKPGGTIRPAKYG